MDIYIPNTYTNIYYRIVNRSFEENRKRSDDRIYEEHHIIPKSCGGSNDPNNLVLLTPKEHYICHRLLPKMVKSRLHYEKMIYALWYMINGSGHIQRHSPSGKIYQQIKEEQSVIRSARMSGSGNHFYGKTHSIEFKKWISENNPAKREDVKIKMRGPRPDYKPQCYYYGHSEVTKQKLREANLGKTVSDEAKMKMTRTRSDKIWIKKDGKKSKHVQLQEAEKYLASGWEFGRHLGLQTKKRNKYTEDQKKALSDKLSNRIWIKKDGEPSKHVDAAEFEIYSTLGWTKGRGNNSKGRQS